MRIGVFVVLAALTLGGCTSTPANDRAILDPRGNLNGDPTRTYMDILSASVGEEEGFYAFSVRAASRFPEPRDMAGGKRVDFIWFVDADRNKSTGQSANGNDYNLHLYLDETGWHPMVAPVSEAAKKHGMSPLPTDCQFRVKGTTATLLVPAKALPASEFDWWVWSMTQNAPGWPPVTENPATQHATF